MGQVKKSKGRIIPVEDGTKSTRGGLQVIRKKWTLRQLPGRSAVLSVVEKEQGHPQNPEQKHLKRPQLRNEEARDGHFSAEGRGAFSKVLQEDMLKKSGRKRTCNDESTGTERVARCKPIGKCSQQTNHKTDGQWTTAGHGEKEEATPAERWGKKKSKRNASQTAYSLSCRSWRKLLNGRELKEKKGTVESSSQGKKKTGGDA